MAFGAGVLSWIPSLAWVVFYVIMMLVALYYLLLVRADRVVAWAFGLLLASGLVLVFSELGLLDGLFGSAVYHVLVLGAMVLFGKHVTG